MAEGRGRARGTPTIPPLPPQARSQPQVGVRGTGPGWDRGTDAEGGAAWHPPSPQHGSSRDRTLARQKRQAGEAPRLCGGRLPSQGSEGAGQKDLLPRPQTGDAPAGWVPPGAGSPRCPLQSPPQTGFSSSFILVGEDMGAPSLASLTWSQSFSCARLSSVMPWAASSARTLSR